MLCFDSTRVLKIIVFSQGHPFMQSITENRAFFYSILGASGVVVLLVTRIAPDLCDTFEVVPFPPEVSSEHIKANLAIITKISLYSSRPSCCLRFRRIS